MSRPRIALVTPNLPVPHDPARGRYLHETAQALSRLAEVRVFFPQIRHPRLPGLRPRSYLGGIVGPDFRLDGIALESYTYPGIPGLSRAINGLVGARALLPRLRRFAPDLVLAYWVFPDGDAAVRAAGALGVPCVVGARGSDINARSGLGAWLTRRTLRRADAVLTVSRAMQGAVIEGFGVDPAKTTAIVNGIDTAVFHPRDRGEMRQRLGIAPDASLLTYVGRLVESKGLCELLEAFAAVRARRSDAVLALVGDGVMRERLCGMVASAGLQDHVLMPGGMAHAEVAEWVCASDLLVLPSWSEGYPNVLVEALACGCPVVATEVGGVGEIVGPDSGILVPPRAPDALAQALARALERDWDHAAISRAMSRGWDEVAGETMAVCTSLLAVHGRGAAKGLDPRRQASG